MYIFHSPLPLAKYLARPNETLSNMASLHIFTTSFHRSKFQLPRSNLSSNALNGWNHTPHFTCTLHLLVQTQKNHRSTKQNKQTFVASMNLFMSYILRYKSCFWLVANMWWNHHFWVRPRSYIMRQLVIQVGDSWCQRQYGVVQWEATLRNSSRWCGHSGQRILYTTLRYNKIHTYIIYIYIWLYIIYIYHIVKYVEI